MRTNRIFLALLLVTLFLSYRVEGQDEKFDATYISLTREFTLNPDGSTEYRYQKQQKLHTYRAFHNLYGETFVVYHPEFQKLKINEVFTVMADGRKTVAPENAFNEVLPRHAENAPAYNAMREMVITHTGLERNSIINLDYQLYSEKGVFPALMGNELLAENEPVENLEIRVRIPAGMQLYYHLFNGDTKPVESTEGQFRVYSWKLRNLSAIVVEEAQPGRTGRYPRLIFSTSPGDDEVFSFLTGQPAFQYALTDPMKRVVNGIVAETTDRFGIALKIQEMVVSGLRLYPLTIQEALYQCRTPEQTWNSHGGTAAEKAVLLASLLQQAGIEARVAAIVKTAFLDKKIATLSVIEDFAVKIETRERGTWYLSVSGLNQVNMNLTLPGSSFIALNPGVKPVVTDSENPEQTVRVLGTFILSSDPKLTGELSIYYDGSAYPFAGMMRDNKQMKRSMTGGLIGNDTNLLKKNTLNTDNGFQTYIVQSDKPFRKDSNYYYFNLPVSTLGIDHFGIRTLSGKRETPYEVPSLPDESYTYTITLPAALGLFTPAKKLNISNKAGTFVWEVKSDEGKVSVKRQLKLNDRVFDVSTYPDFKILMDFWNNPWYRQLVFVAGTHQNR